MADHGYQYAFSESSKAMHNVEGRERKAATMAAVLLDYFDEDPLSLKVLDVGASKGIIDNYLSGRFGFVTGIDIDQKAISTAKKDFRRNNLDFIVGDAMSIDFPDETFDVVLCSQVYEHVPDAQKMMGEIFRVLRPGGICYFAATNRLKWHETHYHLPLLSVVPRRLAHIYLRISGRGEYYHELHYSYWGLKHLVKKFQIVDYTGIIIERPDAFGTSYMLKRGSLKSKVASLIVRYAYWVMPGYIWLLKKPGEFVAQQCVTGGRTVCSGSPLDSGV